MNVLSSHSKSGGSMSKELKTLGIDLAKNIFQLHGVNSPGAFHD
ncbi:hypothetical protein [Legionella feeleii]|nr:hypothetical protein [Legionella feeleii]